VFFQVAPYVNGTTKIQNPLRDGPDREFRSKDMIKVLQRSHIAYEGSVGTEVEMEPVRNPILFLEMKAILIERDHD